MSQTNAIAVQADPLQASRRPLWRVESGGDGLVVVRGVETPDPEPADWRDRLAWFIRNAPGVCMVGAKRFFPSGQVFSLGECVIHPKGFHHVGKGVDGKCYRFPEACDTIAGGVSVVSEPAFERAGGQRLLESLGHLGMLGLGLSVRRDGGGVLAVPQAGVVDTFSPARNREEASAFFDEFGFDWVAPDLDRVREAHAGKGLLWNAAFHAGTMPFEKYDERGAMHWDSYQKADVYRQRAEHLKQLVAKFTLEPDGVGGCVLDVGAGDGLFTHLFATAGCRAIGLDPEPEGIAVAQKMCQAQSYPQGTEAPEFRVGVGDAIPFESETIACAAMLDVIEHLSNPIGVLNEVARVLKPGGHLICVTPAWQYGTSSDPVYHGYEYTQEELNRQINTARGMRVIHNGQIGGVYRDLVVVAKKG
ncbi:MAG: class I SAM-dependent methyltransferase [Phycisphaeraceae bacterium]